MLGGSSLLGGLQGTGADCPESCGCSIPGGAQGHVGWCSGQPDLVGGSQTQEGVGTRWSLSSLPTSSYSVIILT